MYRVLSPGGFAVLMFPIIEAWTETYEDPRYQGTPEDRIAHYAQDDHIKYFGRDVRDHIRAAGFGLDEFVADRSEEHTSETPVTNAHLVCRLLLEKKKKHNSIYKYGMTTDELINAAIRYN